MFGPVAGGDEKWAMVGKVPGATEQAACQVRVGPEADEKTIDSRNIQSSRQHRCRSHDESSLDKGDGDVVRASDIGWQILNVRQEKRELC